MSLLAENGIAVPDVYPTLLARNLVVARSAAALTQHALARRSRVSRATIAMIEAGTGDPRLSTIVMLADALRVSPFQLLLGTAEMNALSQLVLDDTAMSLFHGLAAADPSHVALDIADRARDLATSPGAAVGAALGAASMPRSGACIGAALAYLFDRSRSDRDVVPD